MEDFGILSLLLTLSAFLIYLLTIGSFQYLFRAASQDESHHRFAFWSSILVTAALSSILTISTYIWGGSIASLFNLDTHVYELQLTIVGTSLTSIMIVCLYYHYGLGRNNFQNFLQFLRGSLWVAVAILASVFIDLSLLHILVIFNVSIAVVLLLAFPWSEWKVLVPPVINKESFLQLIRYCLPLLPYFAGAWGIPLIVRSQLNVILGAREVAIFTVAYTLMEIVFMFISTIVSTISPYFFAQTDADRPGLFYNIMLKYSIVCIVLIVPFILLLRYDIILLVASRKYLMSGDYVPILLFFPLLRILIIVFEQYCLKSAQTVYLGIVYTAGIVLSIVLSFALIPAYSILGAIYTSIAAYLAILLLLYIKQHKLIDFEYLNVVALTKLTAVLCGLSILLFFADFHNIIKVAILGIASVISLFLLPIFNEQEKNKITGLFK